MRKLPIGIQDFVGLRQDGYLYVDKTEVKHATGRTDAIIETKDRVCLFEFKLDRATAEDALQQIDDKSYATPYLGSGKSVTKVGVSFDSELKNIERWEVG